MWQTEYTQWVGTGRIPQTCLDRACCPAPDTTATSDDVTTDSSSWRPDQAATVGKTRMGAPIPRSQNTHTQGRTWLPARGQQAGETQVQAAYMGRAATNTHSGPQPQQGPGHPCWSRTQRRARNSKPHHRNPVERQTQQPRRTFEQPSTSSQGGPRPMQAPIPPPKH